ncbi:hypothetical protein LCGC14_2648320 [marine sediment metagenome]|uniref:Uncharacterized protein n=1 Tax=marine sediment metagenome TaxID=412755 RepID=A0A0F8ZVL5_9ZZZZ
MPDAPSGQSDPLAKDPRSFTLYLTVSEVSLTRPTRDRPFPLSYVKCDNFEDGKPLYNGVGSFYFYRSPEEAPKVGEMLEINVKPWKNTFTQGERLEAGKTFVASIIQAEEEKQSNSEE